MSDDLVKRLDQALHFENWMPVPDNFSQAVPLLRESRNRIEELEAKLAKAVEALQWFIDNDDTNEGNEPMPHRGGMTWNEINAYWIDGLNNGRTTLAELKGQGDE